MLMCYLSHQLQLPHLITRSKAGFPPHSLNTQPISGHLNSSKNTSMNVISKFLSDPVPVLKFLMHLNSMLYLHPKFNLIQTSSQPLSNLLPATSTLVKKTKLYS